MGYRKEFIKGVGWIGAFRFGTKLIIFAKVIVAYRFLSPRDVGIFGICTIVLGLLEMITETGINIVLVRDTKPLSYYLDTAYIVSIARGFIVWLAMLIMAFTLPTFFHEPLIFVPLLIASIIPIIRGFINPAVAKFSKDLHFSKTALLGTSQVVYDSLLAIVFVGIYHSATSLIVAMLVSALIEVLISFLFIHPWPKFRFRADVFKDIIHPGKWINLASIIGYAEQNFDNLLVGKLLGSTALGYYQTAFNICGNLITDVGVTLNQVLIPVLGRMGSNRKRTQKALLSSLVPAGVFMLIPLVFINIPSIQHLIILVLKEKWIPSLKLLPYLAIGAWLTGMNTIVSSVFLVKSKFRSLILLYGLNLVFLMLGILIFTHIHGLIGAAQAVMVVRVIMQPLYIWKTKQALDQKYEK